MVDQIAPTAKSVATAMASAPRTTNKCHLTYVVVLSEGVPSYSNDEITGQVVGASRDMAGEGPEIVSDWMGNAV